MTEYAETDAKAGPRGAHNRGIWTLFNRSMAGRAGLVLLAWIAACALWTVRPWGGEFLAKWFAFYDAPLGLFIFLLAWCISRDLTLSPRKRFGWLLLSLTYLATWLGNCTWNVFEVVLEISPFPSIADAFFLVSYPLMFAGLVALSDPLQNRRERLKFSLDVATVMVAATAAVFYFLSNYIQIEPDQSVFEGAVLVAYPVGDVLLVFGVVSVLFKAHSSRRNPIMALILVATLAVFCADMLFLVQSSEGTYQTGGIVDIFFLASFGFMILGALYQYERGNGSESVPTDRKPYPYRFSPYLAVLGGYALLVYDHVSRGIEPSNIPLPTALLLTSLVIVRQVIAARELARLNALQAERRAEERFASLVKHSSDVVLVTDVDGTIRFATPSVERILGWPAQTLPGCNLGILMHHDDVPVMRRFLADSISRPGVSAPVEWRFRNKDDQWQHTEVIASNLLADPAINGLVLNCRDITERKGLEERLRHMAFHDPLTFLPNRNLLNERVHQALERAARQNSYVAVMFVDLDNFKNINDSLGHEVGDNLLVAVAGRLKHVVRPRDMVARLGGDEFAILLEDFKDTQDLTSLADRMINALNMPVVLGDKKVTSSCSIGIAVANPNDRTQDIMRNADVAMYRAKARGKASYEFFEAAMHVQILENMQLEMDMRKALHEREFVIHYQPIVDLQNSMIVGVEALVRWLHPERGLVPPATFIHVAEASDLIVALGRWVLFESCMQGRKWQETFPPDVIRHLAVNISARQLQQESFVEDVKTVLLQTGIRPEMLVLEITESVLMQNVDRTLERLRALKDLGLRLALDDFGTGYSALSYLHQFPFDILKIDRSFVSKITDEASSDALVRTIVAMGYSLGLATVAEGIENTAQLAELRHLGCTYGQGFLFAKAAPAEETAKLLEALRVPALSLIKAG